MFHNYFGLDDRLNKRKRDGRLFEMLPCRLTPGEISSIAGYQREPDFGGAS